MIVTISREFGSGGLGVAKRVARGLGYELLTDDLPRTVAARLGASPDAAAHATTEPSFSERLLGGLGAGTAEVGNPASPPLPDEFDETVRRELERAIRERAAQGNVVILGRNAGAVLAGSPELLRVFLTASLPWRTTHVVEAFGQSREQARLDIDRVDATRRKFARDRYKIAWGDARHYDLIVNTERYGIAGAASVIVAAAGIAAEAMP